MDGNNQTVPNEPTWQYTAQDQTTSPYPSEQSSTTVSWTASEFLAHQKTGSWYAALAAGAVVAAIIVWLLWKDVVSSVVIILAAAAFGNIAARQPRELDYRLDAHGLTIGAKRYPYGYFRSFAVIKEGAMPSILFMPLKRFSPTITVYYDPADEQAITTLLSAYLPVSNQSHDPIDRLMWRIRF